MHIYSTTTQKSLYMMAGVSLGVGLFDLDHVTDTVLNAEKKGYRSVSPFFIPRILVNMAAGIISIKHKFHGPNLCVSTACTTGMLINISVRLVCRNSNLQWSKEQDT